MAQALKKDFDLKQYCHSDTADSYHCREQYDPPQEIILNLIELHENLVLPVMNLFSSGQFFITSGYRCQRVNDLVHGSHSSYHLQGCAVDIEYYYQGKERNDLLLEKIKKSGLKWTELIDEYNKSWIHLAFKKGVYTDKVKVIK